jgi:hypothetical protein
VIDYAATHQETKYTCTVQVQRVKGAEWELWQDEGGNQRFTVERALALKKSFIQTNYRGLHAVVVQRDFEG